MKLTTVRMTMLSLLLSAVLFTGCGVTWQQRPPAPPPAPTTCYVRAQGDNAILEVSGVQALRSCHAFQEATLKTDSGRILEVSETKPDPSTLKMPLFPTKAEQDAGAPTVKQTCSYILQGTTYTVTDTGGQTIGGSWCKRFYQQSVELQAKAERRG